MENLNIILYSSHGCDSAEFIGKHVPKVKLVTRSDDDGQFIIRNNDLSNEKSTPPDTILKDSIVIRWGTQLPLAMEGCTVYNKAAAIRHASNKKQARKLLNENGISIPKLVTKGNFSPDDLPILGRPSKHSKCRNMIILRTQDEFMEHWENNNPKGWYYSKIIDKDHEYRFHCAHGKILAIQEKPRPKNKTTLGWGYAVIEQADWRVLMWEEYNREWCLEVLKAMDVMGLDFGAVDVITKDGKMYILEINTAGCLTESKTLKLKYSRYFKWLIGSETKRKHWDYSKYKQVTSLAWNDKNFEQ